MTEVLDMNKVPLAGNFLNKENIGREKVYPLTVSVCQDCSFVQVNEVVNKKDLFADYRYISTIPLGKHFEDYAKEIAFKFLKKGNFIVDIGSNDGTLLRSYKTKKLITMGFEPALNLIDEAREGIDFVVPEFFNAEDYYLLADKKAKVVTSIAMFYDLDNPNRFLIFPTISSIVKCALIK